MSCATLGTFCGPGCPLGTFLTASPPSGTLTSLGQLVLRGSHHGDGTAAEQTFLRPAERPFSGPSLAPRHPFGRGPAGLAWFRACRHEAYPWHELVLPHVRDTPVAVPTGEQTARRALPSCSESAAGSALGPGRSRSGRAAAAGASPGARPGGFADRVAVGPGVRPGQIQGRIPGGAAGADRGQDHGPGGHHAPAGERGRAGDRPDVRAPHQRRGGQPGPAARPQPSRGCRALPVRPGRPPHGGK